MMFSGMPPPTGEPSAVAEAERFFSEALKVDANCQFALEALGSLELQRGNVARAVELFDRAIAAARSEQELAHLFELREAADVHRAVRERYGVSIDPAALLAAAQANAAAFEVPPD
jgi:tetratricopeptide (TPR) repeat protein